MAEVESGSQRLSNQFSSNNCLLLFLLSIVVVIAVENSFWPSLLKHIHTHARLCNEDKCNILAVTISLYRCDTC